MVCDYYSRDKTVYILLISSSLEHWSNLKCSSRVSSALVLHFVVNALHWEVGTTTVDGVRMNPNGVHG